MKVILLQDVKNVGKKNQIIEVSDGYGSNFLIPRKLAVRYSEHGVEVRDKQIQHEKDEFVKKQNEAKEVKAKIEAMTLEFTAPASKDGRMMGTISEKMIVQELKDNIITCSVENDGILKNRKGINVPATKLSMPFISEKDYRIIIR